ncbi:MAG: suppressor of fused domain protein [Thermoguttaceae bacterium]
MHNDDEPRAMGWAAINAALAPIYGGREPKHYGTLMPAMLGGKDPLRGISVYKNVQPLPHFHYVTYGFSELYQKESENRELSGFGFELTFRLACNAGDEDPPVWALNFLQNIARYVFSSGNRLEEHHHIDLNGPIALAEETEICCIALAKDPQLGEIDSENGHVSFLQVVGLCADEYELIKDWNCGRMLEHVGHQWPLLITDLKRKSILTDPDFAADVRAQAEREGSSQGETFVTEAQWLAEGDSLLITIGATAACHVVKQLKTRLMHNKPFVVYGRQQGIVFQPHANDAWKSEGALAVLSLSPQTLVEMLNSLKPERGVYRWASLPNIVIRVDPSEIKGQDGNVIHVIG